MLEASDRSEVAPPSTRRLRFRVNLRAVAAGDFLPDRQHRSELALLGEDGSLRLLQREGAGRQGRESQRAGVAGQGREVWCAGRVMAGTWQPEANPPGTAAFDNFKAGKLSP